MFNRNDPERKIRQVKGWRRLTAFLCAFMLLFSSCGLNAFAQTIYSDPVTVPAQNTESPEETPAPADAAVTGEDAEPVIDESAAEDAAEVPGTDEPGEPAGETPAEDVPASGTDVEQTEGPDEEETAAEAGDNTNNDKTEEAGAEPEIEYFPGTLTLETAEGSVRIEYPAEARLPENTVLSLMPVKGTELYAALKSAAKLIRNEENDTWQRQVADEGNRFWMPALKDTDGNELRPQAGVTLSFTTHEAPKGVEWFRAGDNAGILEV